MNEDILLPSGASLKITLSPFAVSKALYQAVLEEMKALRLDPKAEVDINIFKDLFCAGFSSKKIEQCIEKCFEKCLYNKMRITDETFEVVTAREDYMTVCWEVAYANISPFTKNLTQQYNRMLEVLTASPLSK